MASVRDGVIITSSYLTGEEPVRSDRYSVQGIECKREHGEFDYCDGLQSAWQTDKVLVNIEHDMETSDDLVDGLVRCPYPVCAYAYQVYPTALKRYIYCATSRKRWKAGDDGVLEVDTLAYDGTDRGFNYDPRIKIVGQEYISWLEEGDEWAVWSSIGFCKIAPVARAKPLDRLFWQWIEHSINRSVGVFMRAGGAGYDWHIHWPAIEHHHDYGNIPDHLW